MAPVISYRPHLHQAKLHASPARFKVARAGRQSGKSLGAIAELTSWTTERLGKQLIYWVTANYRVKDRAWRGLAEHLPKEIVKKRHESDLYVELSNGSRIYIRSADAPESLVSETLDGLVCDEAAQWKPDIWPQHLRPMLAVKKAPAVFISSPRGRNWFYDLEQRARSTDDPEWEAFSWRSTDSPYFTKEEYDRAKEEMPDRLFRQEIEAEYLVDGGEIFRNVSGAVRPFAKADAYTVLGIDCALTNDWFVIWGSNSRGECIAFDRFRRVDWPIAKVRLINMYRSFHCSRVLIDTTGMNIGQSAIATDLQREGVQVETITITGPLKRALIENAMLRFEQSAVSIPNDPVVVEEFNSFTSETMPSGSERFGAPSGRHDDCVIACCLALWGVRQFYGQPVGAAPDEDDFARMIRLDIERDTARNRGDWAYFESHGDSWGDDDDSRSSNEWSN